MQLTELFESFLKEKTYLKNASLLTIKSFRHTWLRFIKAMGERDLSELAGNSSKSLSSNFGTANSAHNLNISIREFNSFLSWLHENEYIEAQLKIKQLKVEKKVMRDFTDE